MKEEPQQQACRICNTAIVEFPFEVCDTCEDKAILNEAKRSLSQQQAEEKILTTGNMKWIKITEELPPSHQLVWVKRAPNRVESEPIYLGLRRGSQEISTNPDASKDCYWQGCHYNAAFANTVSINEPFLTSSFSDVTVEEWAIVEKPF